MTKPTENSKCRPPLKPLGKFTEPRMERGGSGSPAKTPLFVARIQTVQECEGPISAMAGDLCAPSLVAVQAMGRLRAAKCAQGESAYFRQRENSSS